jgi:hypothetical protein
MVQRKRLHLHLCCSQAVPCPEMRYQCQNFNGAQHARPLRTQALISTHRGCGMVLITRMSSLSDCTDASMNGIPASALLRCPQLASGQKSLSRAKRRARTQLRCERAYLRHAHILAAEMIASFLAIRRALCRITWQTPQTRTELLLCCARPLWTPSCRLVAVTRPKRCVAIAQGLYGDLRIAC